MFVHHQCVGKLMRYHESSIEHSDIYVKKEFTGKLESASTRSKSSPLSVFLPVEHLRYMIATNGLSRSHHGLGSVPRVAACLVRSYATRRCEAAYRTLRAARRAMPDSACALSNGAG